MTRITHTVPIQGCATIQRAPVWQVCILAAALATWGIMA